jgi:hypothetical protein
LGGSAMLMLALWVHGWHVAYVTPDPPVSPPFRWPRLGLSLFGLFGIFRWMFGLVFGLFKRRETAAAAPKRRKKAEETGTTKRKRKTKKPARRSRAKVVEEEEAAEDEEEEVAEEEAEESEEYEEESSEAEEESYEEEEAPRGRVTAPAAGKSYAQHAPSRTQEQPVPKPHANFAAASNQQSYDDEDDESDDGESGRDGPPAEQLKGLSKRQRRALIKQYRDQQRSQRR